MLYALFILLMILMKSLTFIRDICREYVRTDKESVTIQVKIGQYAILGSLSYNLKTWA